MHCWDPAGQSSLRQHCLVEWSTLGLSPQHCSRQTREMKKRWIMPSIKLLHGSSSHHLPLAQSTYRTFVPR